MIAEGIIMLCLAIAGGVKIYKGSKIPFAYTMIAFTFAYGLDFVIRGAVDALSGEEWSYYLFNSVWYIYFSLSI
jgi:hypothetical protein